MTAGRLPTVVVQTRRALVVAAAAALTGPRAWSAGTPKRIGLFTFPQLGTKPGAFSGFDIFFAGMRALGYEEGRDYVVVWKVTESTPEAFAVAAKEMAASGVDVVVTFTSTSTDALKNATSTIPIVFAGLNDPVRSGLVASLARPGGNITGFSAQNEEVSGRRVQLLRELLPSMESLAVLWTRDDITHGPELKLIESAARNIGVQVRLIEVRKIDDIESAFEQLQRLRPSAVLHLSAVGHTGPVLSALFGAAARARLPTLGSTRAEAAWGALLSYGADLDDLYRRRTAYVDLIMKGAKPADLPVQQPTKFEFIINLKTANELGVQIPIGLLGRADDIIR
jgi:putative ABC transport system substrate-binding protein